MAFARKMKRLLPEDFWTSGISFYLDGTSFTHTSSPCDQAKCQRSMVWRKRCEALSFNCISKGKKSGTGGAMGHFIVAIAHGKGVVLCEQYVEQFIGAYFADFIRELFHEAFANSANLHGKLFMQDGDPWQNSMAAKKTLDDVSARLFSIPPRSPDVNPNKNFFYLVQSKFHGEALDRKDCSYVDYMKS